MSLPAPPQFAGFARSCRAAPRRLNQASPYRPVPQATAAVYPALGPSLATSLANHCALAIYPHLGSWNAGARWLSFPAARGIVRVPRLLANGRNRFPDGTLPRCYFASRTHQDTTRSPISALPLPALVDKEGTKSCALP